MTKEREEVQELVYEAESRDLAAALVEQTRDLQRADIDAGRAADWPTGGTVEKVDDADGMST